MVVWISDLPLAFASQRSLRQSGSVQKIPELDRRVKTGKLRGAQSGSTAPSGSAGIGSGMARSGSSGSTFLYEKINQDQR